MTLSDRYDHEIPFPLAIRAMLFIMGAAACILTVWELGRGIWPLNAFTPFFAIIVGGGCFVGGAFMLGAIAGPAVVMSFAPGELTITKTWPWGTAVERHDADAILGMRVEIDRSSDGPDQWFVQIAISDGTKLSSRRFGSVAAADAERSAFAAALSGPQSTTQSTDGGSTDPA